MTAFKKFDVQEFLRGEYIPPTPTLVSLGTLGLSIDDKVKLLTPAQYEEWEERAAIMEYDGGMPRNIAEREAYNNVIDMRRYKNEKFN